MTIRTYIFGFALSILLTLAAFWAAAHAAALAIPAIIIAALLQLFVQAVFFLHLGRRSSQTNTAVFGLTLIIIFILVGGTLWIMQNLMRFHMLGPTTHDLYQGGVVAPQNELK